MKPANPAFINGYLIGRLFKEVQITPTFRPQRADFVRIS
ncbi:hypothetical protein NUACC26_096870 [Scytonema sp. NUACC26]